MSLAYFHVAEHHGLLDDHPFFYSTPYHADYLTCLGGDFSKVSLQLSSDVKWIV